jgi:hypothetical protein
VTVTSNRDRHWELFADWCTATDRQALPATGDTLLAFLDDLPAGPATISRRVRSIDTVHLRAGHPPPGAAPALDQRLRPERPPRFDPDQVAAALANIPVGGWPVGIIGRRDAAIVALVCSAGMTRRHIRNLRTATAATVPALAAADEPGGCPACALSRWTEIHYLIAAHGWRQAREYLADLGEIAADDETSHHCTQPAEPATSEPGRPGPLFSPIDRHGAPDPTWPLSTRTITTIATTRLTATGRRPWEAEVSEPARRGEWDDTDRARVTAQRDQAAARLAELDTDLDQADAYAEEILRHLNEALDCP